MGEKQFEDKLSFVEIDPQFIACMAERLNVNKNKYPVGNWKQPIDILLLIDSIDRHLTDLKLLLDGRDPILNKSETPKNHLAAIAVNCQFINWQLNEYPK